MALREARLTVRFGGGLNTKVDRKGVPTAQLIDLQNRVFTKSGTLVKRNGYTDLGTSTVDGTPMPAGKALAHRGSELLAFTDDALYSYLDDSGKWQKAADVQSVKVSHTVAANTSSDQTMADSAEYGGVAVYAWEDSSGGVYWSVIDASTRRVMKAPAQLHSTGVAPQVRAVGSQLVIFVADSAARIVWSYAIDPTNATATPSAYDMITDLCPSFPVFDVDTTDSEAVVIWSTDNSTVKAGYVTVAGRLGSSGTGYATPISHSLTGGTEAKCVSIAWDAGGTSQIAMSWVVDGTDYIAASTRDSDLTSVHSWNTNFSANGAFRSLASCWQRDDSAAGNRTYWIWGEVAGATNRDNYVVTVSKDGLSPGIAIERTQRGVGLASRGFRYVDHVYVGLMHDSTYWTTYFVQREDGLTVARFLPGTAGGLPARAALPNVQTSSNLRTVAAVYATQLESEDGSVFTEKGIRAVVVDMAPADRVQTAMLGQALYIGGGMPQLYDGNSVVESGFHYAPDDVTAGTLGTPTGDGVDVGTHNYRFVYEWPTAQGEIERGPASIPSAVEVTDPGDPQSVTFSAIPTMRLTAKAGVRIGVFRTLANDASRYFRVTSLNPSTTGINGYLANDATADTVSFVDEMSDATLRTQEPLYTNGGIVSNDPIAGGQVITTGKGRIFTNDPSDANVVQFSQQIDPGYAAEFSPANKLRCDPFGGDVTGLVVMDDALIIFKQRAIYYVAGPGPTAGGTFGDGGQRFTEPTLITSDVGCTSQRSIGYTPDGVLFQSSKGVYMLGRDRQVKYIGAPVEAYNAQTIKSTDLIPDKTHIIFLTDSGSTLLYDYHHDQWSRFTNHEGVDATVIGSTYYYLRNDGAVWKQSSGYADVNRSIKSTIETAELHFVNWLQGWQAFWRMQLIGRHVSDHDLRISIAKDYRAGWENPFDVDVSAFIDSDDYGDGSYGDGPYGGDTDNLYQVSVHLGTKGQSIRFKFEDIETVGTTGGAFELSELTVTGGVMRGRAPVNAERMS